jgi:protein tyrosine phosphatase (PTP) superfamily phosphohydrolase (DUF442 family)
MVVRPSVGWAAAEAGLPVVRSPVAAMVTEAAVRAARRAILGAMVFVLAYRVAWIAGREGLSLRRY